MVLLPNALNTGGAAVTVATSAPAGNGTYDGEIQLIIESDRINLYIWDDTNTAWVICEVEPIQGTGSPSGSVTPDFIGQSYIDTAAGTFYRADGLTNTDWVAL